MWGRSPGPTTGRKWIGSRLLEEGDAYPFATASSSIYAELWGRAFALMEKAGAHASWARHLPARLAAAGAADVAAAGDVQMFTGGSPHARFTILTMDAAASIPSTHQPVVRT